MHGGPHAEAALSVLFAVYGFSREAQAWDVSIDASTSRPTTPQETGAGVPVGPPVDVTARRCFDIGHGIGFFTLAQKGKTLPVGDGSILGPGDEDNVIYAVSHDVLSMPCFRWPELLQKGE
jgi:hypothetical protein